MWSWLYLIRNKTYHSFLCRQKVFSSEFNRRPLGFLSKSLKIVKSICFYGLLIMFIYILGKMGVTNNTGLVSDSEHTIRTHRESKLFFLHMYRQKYIQVCIFMSSCKKIYLAIIISCYTCFKYFIISVIQFFFLIKISIWLIGYFHMLSHFFI